MPINPKTLRMVFAAIGAAVLVAVVGFYGYGRYRIHSAVREMPAKLGVNVQQSASGFKISKSEAGRMLFSISAANAVQYKGGQKATLKDARIIVYNRGKGTNDPATDIYDQIYGKQFDYDHTTGDIIAAGDVLIDLQAKGTPSDDPAEATGSAGALHLKTSGLTFNEKTGVAETDQTIEFALPQGDGSARGAFYDSKMMTVHLKADVRLRTVPNAAKKSGAVTITADNADIFDMPKEAILSGVHIEDEAKTRTMAAARLTLTLRDDNTIEKALASEGVKASVQDAAGGVTSAQCTQANLIFGAENNLKTALLSGAVKMDSRGSKSEMHASAGKAELEFGAKTQLAKIHATESVVLSNAGPQNLQDGFALNAGGVDFFLKGSNRLDRAITSGAAQVTLDSKPGSAQKTASRTVATADRFEALFGPVGEAKNKMQSVHGTGNTKVVSSLSGSPDRMTTGHELLVRFDAKTGSIARVEQSGDFKYTEAGRSASAERASFNLATDQLMLNGSPRVQNSAQGLSLTANAIRMNRRSGEVNADGEVKATYNQTKSNPGGAMLSGRTGEPIHATSQQMTASKASGVARFIGKARLWQGVNVVEAPQITFDNTRRSLTAEGSGSGAEQVQTAFVQTDKKGKVTPVSVMGGKLVYSDGDRKAHFDGGIRLTTGEMTMAADHADVFLKPRGVRSSAADGSKDSASQIDRIEAEGKIVLQEQNPVRKVTGSRLVYTADEGKFVMTGEPGKSPSIFDAERGDLTGDSLTFYIHDDRVQVGSGENSRIVTRTRIKDERKP